jgi:hypothetical protein
MARLLMWTKMSVETVSISVWSGGGVHVCDVGREVT